MGDSQHRQYAKLSTKPATKSGQVVSIVGAPKTLENGDTINWKKPHNSHGGSGDNNRSHRNDSVGPHSGINAQLYSENGARGDGPESFSCAKTVYRGVPKQELFVDVGLQTDLEEDPDVYYFAGGRHVSSQTDYDSDYEPLIPFESDTKLEIVVLPDLADEPCSSLITSISTNNTTLTTACDMVCATRTPNDEKDVVLQEKDGWRTVTARSNRSKWSQSTMKTSCSLKNSSFSGSSSLGAGKKSSLSASHQKVMNRTANITAKKKDRELVNSDACHSLKKVHQVGIVKPATEANSSTGKTSPNCSDKWKENDAESSNDDEEIQQKEAALASAIQESEKLEEELLQVEKDFEEIENRTTDSASVEEGSNTSEGDTAPSPTAFREAEAEISESNGDLDQFFFVAINDKSAVSIEESIDERIVAKKEKLRLSPSKKCDSAETLKRYRAKLAKAERNRELLLQAKYNQYVQLSEKFASLNETTKRLVEERYELMAKADERRKRAAEKRELHLRSIVKKAHDEDSKAKEIAFINYLEAQNKRHEYLANVQEVEDRLNSIQEERKLKFEDRAIKVQAVIERQTHIRKNWETKLDAMQEKRRKIDERIMREKEERAKERSEIAQEKARDREERISALNAAKKAEKEELQKKIQQKQEETARRHEENIEQIRQKAIELTLPRSTDEACTAIVRICSVCKVSMASEVQELAHLRGKTHLDAVRNANASEAGTWSKVEQFGLKFITSVQADKIEPGVRQDKNRSKKCSKKLLVKLYSAGEQFEKRETEKHIEKPWGDPTLKSKVIRNLRELERCINLFSSGKGSPNIANSMEKILADIRRTINKNKSVNDASVSLGAFTIVTKILQCTAADLPQKVLIGACNMVVGATYQHVLNGIYVLRSTVICGLLELIVNRLSYLVPDGNRWLGNWTGNNDALQADSVADFAIETLLTVLSIVPDPYDGISRQSKLSETDVFEIIYRTQDIIGYLVSANVIDRLAVYCSGVQGPVDNQPAVANMLKISLDFLTALVWCLTFCLEKTSTLNDGKKEPDPTSLLAALESSELASSISMSYALLLHQGAPPRPRLITHSEPNSANSSDSRTFSALSISDPKVPPPPGSRTASVVKSTLCLINAVARLDIESLQSVLGSEAVSLQFRHIASQLLWQVVPYKEDRLMWGLLQELFIALGNFTVKNRQNQMTIQSGQAPTVLQQLCTVAKEFLTNLKLSRSILPTLIAATYGCPENRELLEQENFPTDLLDGFLGSKFSHANLILKRLVAKPEITTTSENEKL